MTLEEAIADSEKLLKKIDGGDTIVSEYHQQLVDWFKELQAYRKCKLIHEQEFQSNLFKEKPVNIVFNNKDDSHMFPKVCPHYPDDCPYNFDGFEVTSETCNRCFGKDHYNE